MSGIRPETMKKKNYEAIAGIIASNPFSHLTSGHNANLHNANAFADYFAQDNPLFQRDKFLAACGIEHKHDWDNYGKCCDCGKWDTEGERLQ